MWELSIENIGILLKQTPTLKIIFSLKVHLNSSLFITLWSCAVLCALEVLSISLLCLAEAPGVFLLGKGRSHCSWVLAVLGILSHHIWRCDSTRLLCRVLGGRHTADTQLCLLRPRRLF